MHWLPSGYDSTDSLCWAQNLQRCLVVLYVIPSLAARYGGPSRSVRLLCEAMARTDSADIEVLVADVGHTDLGFRVSRVSVISLIRGAALASRSHSVFHVNALWNPTSTFAMRSLRQLRHPYILSLHGMLRPETIRSLKKRLWARIWERANVAGAAAIHVTSEDELEAARACSWQLPPAALIPNPIEIPEGHDAVYGHRRQPINGCRSIFYVGRLSWIKRLPLLLEAFAVLHKQSPDVRLLIAGPDSEGLLPDLKRTAQRFGIAAWVDFLGMQTQTQLSDLFGQASVATLVSQRENFGMAAAEAMGHGVPAVLTKHVGIASAAKKAGAALVVEDSPEAIADGLLRVLRDRELAQAMSERARAFVQREYSPARIAAQMIEVYKWVLGEGPQPACVRLD